ncbi:hypothetical protein AVEN_136791-1 [Araneus ventricosus]|uniref:Chitin-binding type-2 domain-containing protein n=1 Tax=Araneus ventricosus TaxID=182803 RepID=A0A4Y2N159_ARAVE|nr:hypothetical protein AVEN_136791-1 [Araneus ventricosus]
MKHLQTFSFLVLTAVLSYASAFNNETRKDEYQLQNLKHYTYNFNFCPTLYGRYPHPRDCSMFWECRNGSPYLLQCVRGKLYDATRGLCMEKHLVECKLDREVKDRDDKDEDKDNWDKDKDNWDKDKDKDVANFKCPYNWGFFEHPYDCSKFFACKGDIPLVTDCPRGTLWDDKEKGCVDWRYVKCGNRWDKYRILSTTKRPFQPPTTPLQPRTTTETPTTRVSSVKFLLVKMSGVERKRNVLNVKQKLEILQKLDNRESASSDAEDVLNEGSTISHSAALQSAETLLDYKRQKGFDYGDITAVRKMCVDIQQEMNRE